MHSLMRLITLVVIPQSLTEEGFVSCQAGLRLQPFASLAFCVL
jgi:hypothetical protein